MAVPPAQFHAWQSRPPLGAGGREPFRVGEHQGTTVTDAGLTVDTPAGERVLTDPFGDAADGSVNYQSATWTSPLHRPADPAREIVVSWNAGTPGRSWIEVQVQAITRPADPGDTPGRDAGDTADPRRAETPGNWLTMARWCELLPAEGGAIHRASVAGQADAGAVVDTDTLRARDGRTITGYRLRVNLLIPADSPPRSEPPVVSLLGAVASGPRTPGPAGPVPAGRPTAAVPTPTSVPGPAPVPARELPVRPLSQMTHRGQYPEWGGGGGSWCSPTSVAMAMAYHRVGPTHDELAWVRPPEDAVVAFSARATWDHQYEGAGNWAFSTAYPAEYGLEAFVTRLASLSEMEPFIDAGIPVVASVSFDADELDHAGYSTEGHLLLVIGFTGRGDVVVNDPASHEVADNDQVRVVYRRDQFEQVWLPRSGGTVYVIHPPRTPLPAGPATGI